MPNEWWTLADSDGGVDLGGINLDGPLKALSVRAHYFAAGNLPGWTPCRHWYSGDGEMCPRACRCCKASCALCAELMRLRSSVHDYSPLEEVAPIICTLMKTGCRRGFHCPPTVFRIRVPLPRPAIMPRVELVLRRPAAAEPAPRRRGRWAAGTLCRRRWAAGTLRLQEGGSSSSFSNL